VHRRLIIIQDILLVLPGKIPVDYQDQRYEYDEGLDAYKTEQSCRIAHLMGHGSFLFRFPFLICLNQYLQIEPIIPLKNPELYYKKPDRVIKNCPMGI
jgi:hypothetical protein